MQSAFRLGKHVTLCLPVTSRRLASANPARSEINLPSSQLSLKDLTLRPYQTTCVDKALEALRDGHRRIGISAPTGSGKTLMIASLIDRLPILAPKATKHLVIVSGMELVRQVSQQLKRFLPHMSVEVEQGSNQASGLADITVATIQSLYRRLEKYSPDLYKVIVIDEAHHAAAQTYMSTLEHFDPGTRARFEQNQRDSAKGLHPASIRGPDDLSRPRIVGFTATFSRSDHLSLRRAFDYIAHHVDLKELIEQKWLSAVDFESVVTSAALANVAVNQANQDFVESSLSKAMIEPQILNEVVACWRERASHRRSCLVFAVDVQHTIALLEAFRAHGVAAGYILGEMPTKERQEVMTLFRDGTLPVLVNCNVLTEGTDIPEIDTVILARPTRSKSRYWQMVGRGLRISPQSGKTSCLVLDFDSTFPGLIHWPALMYGEATPARLREQETEEELDEQSERSILDELPEPREPDSFKLDFDPFDPFALSPKDMAGAAEVSPLAWVATGPKRWTLDAGQLGRLRIEQRSENFALFYRPGLRFSRKALIAEKATFSEILQRGDQYAHDAFSTHACRTLLSKEARWRTDPPSYKQITSLLKLLGSAADLLPNPYSLNKGEVASAMTALTRGGKRALIQRLELRKTLEGRKAKAAALIEAKEVPLLSKTSDAGRLDSSGPLDSDPQLGHSINIEGQRV